MYENENGEYEVVMDIGKDIENREVFEGLVGAGMKFAMDHGMHEESDFVLESEDDE